MSNSVERMDQIKLTVSHAVRQHMQRGILLYDGAVFEDLIRDILIHWCEPTCENWMHAHNFNKFREKINDNRILFMFYCGVNTSVMSRLSYYGMTVRDIINSCFCGLSVGDDNNALLVNEDVLSHWPTDRDVSNNLMTNSLLLTIFLIHEHCDMLEIIRDVRDSVKDLKKLTKVEVKDE